MASSVFLGLTGKIWMVGFLVYAMILVISTHYPEVKLPDTPGSDKWLHAIAYVILMGLWSGYSMTKKQPTSWILSGIPLLMIFGGIDELTQPLFDRHADIMDWVYDVLGISVTGAIYLCGFVQNSSSKL